MDTNEERTECVCVRMRMHRQACTRVALGAVGCLLWYSLLVSMVPVATHACFSESHQDCLFHPRPGRQPRSCRHLFIFL